jgi:hypothetical protein
VIIEDGEINELTVIVHAHILELAALMPQTMERTVQAKRSNRAKPE